MSLTRSVTDPDPELVVRFRRDLEALPGPLGSDVQLGLAVSGGADSLAMLLLAAAAWPGRVFAATVDHGQREESAGEAEFVAGICARLGVAHDTLTLAPFDRGNLSDWARRERYRALGEWAGESDLRYVLTAHHADDQLETIVMRLNRGSGVAGLSGVRARNDRVLRPLLGWRRSELADIVTNAGLVPIDDPTNRDARRDRARVRKALTGADWLDPIAASRSATALAEAEDALNWTAQIYYRRRVTSVDGGLRFDPRELPAELVRRIVVVCLQEFSAGAPPRADVVTRAMAALYEGRTTTLAGVKCSGGESWTFTPAPPRRTKPPASS